MQSLPLNPRPYFKDEKASSTPFLYPSRGNKNVTNTLNSWMSSRRLVAMYQLCTQTWQLRILSKYPITIHRTQLQSSKKHTSLPPSAPHGATAPIGQGPSYYRGFTIRSRHTTPGRIPLDERSAWRKDLYLTIYYTQNRLTSRLPAGFEHAIPGSERPQTHALESASTRNSISILNRCSNS